MAEIGYTTRLSIQRIAMAADRTLTLGMSMFLMIWTRLA